MATAMKPEVTSKQLLGHETLTKWREIKNQLCVEAENLLRLGREVKNSRMKFLARILQKANQAKIIAQLENITDEDRAFKTEAQLEDYEECEKQKNLINRLWAVMPNSSVLEKLADPFLTERVKFISSVIGSYQAGTLCFDYSDLVTRHNEAIVVLHKQFPNMAKKKKKQKQLKVTEMVPMESCVVA